MQKLLLRPTEVTQMLSLSRSTVYQLIASGELKSIRLGRAIRIPVKSLEEWIESNQQDKGLSED